MGYFQIRLLAHIYEGVLFLGVDLPDFKCRWTRSFPWDGMPYITRLPGKKITAVHRHFKSGLHRPK